MVSQDYEAGYEAGYTDAAASFKEVTEKLEAKHRELEAAHARLKAVILTMKKSGGSRNN